MSRRKSTEDIPTAHRGSTVNGSSKQSVDVDGVKQTAQATNRSHLRLINQTGPVDPAQNDSHVRQSQIQVGRGHEDSENADASAMEGNQGAVEDENGGVDLVVDKEKELPQHLHELGVQLLGSTEAVDAIVAGSDTQHITYAGEEVLVRMLDGDWANTTFRGEGQGQGGVGVDYGLDALRELTSEGLLRMLDLGGNLGIASIAAFKKYPEHLQAIAVEPVPSTYFFLRWNMWLNDVPELNRESISEAPGIFPLNRGVSDSDDKTIEFCYAPPQSMNSFACTCASLPGYECKEVSTVSTKQLLDYFDGQNITLLKMDCEGCEAYTLPALGDIASTMPGRVTRTVGELHHPGVELEELACKLNAGRFFWEVCPVETPAGGYESRQLDCNADQRPCQTYYTSDHVTPPLTPGKQLLALLGYIKLERHANRDVSNGKS
jgi:FkbM family methyltransferase